MVEVNAGQRQRTQEIAIVICRIFSEIEMGIAAQISCAHSPAEDVGVKGYAICVGASEVYRV